MNIAEGRSRGANPDAIRIYRERISTPLERYPGLLETLHFWSASPSQQIERPEQVIEFGRVVDIMVRDKSAREAVKDYLTGTWSDVNGNDVNKSMNEVREELAWAVIDELSRQLFPS